MNNEKNVNHAVDELLSAIEIDDGVVYQIELLGQEAKEYLMSLLSSDPTDPAYADLIRNAIFVLSYLGCNEVIPKLKKMTNSPDENIQARAIHALGRIDSTTAEEESFRVIESSDYKIATKGHALMVLDQVIHQRSTERFRKWVAANDIPELRSLAEGMLVEMEARKIAGTNTDQPT